MSDETVTPETEEKARSMGWVSKDEFQGDPEKWIPADQYVDRGEHLLPILHSTNKRLKEQVATQERRLAEVEEALRVGRETIASLETYHDEDVKQKVEKARKELREQLAEANRAGDHETAATVTEEMTRLNTAEGERTGETEKKAAKKESPAPQDYTKHPDFVAWKDSNPWYGVDLVRTSIANTLSWKLRSEGETALGRAYLDKIAEGVEKEILKLTGGRKPDNKVEGGGASGGRSSGANGKSYSDLPSEAKAACDSFEKTLVGPNKMYKTRDEWRKKYAERHFTEI